MAKKYNEIEAKDNMKINSEDENQEEVREKEPMTQRVSAQPTKVKKSLMGRFVGGLVGPEGLPGIGSYVNEEIVKPAIKNIIVDAVTSGINAAVYGATGGHRPGPGRHTPYSQAPRNYRPATNYGSSYRNAPPEPAQPVERAARPNRSGVTDYMIADRNEAAEVLTSLTEYADRYDTVSVADYYDAIGIAGQFTDNNYGWTFDSITRASIVPVRGGYIIKFPPVEVI